VNDETVAIATKLGTGASTAAANQVLRGTGTGTSAFGAITNDDLPTITTAGKISGAALTLLANIPAGAGAIPAANLTNATTNVKVGSFTRDTSAASGDQAITGVGFTPKAVIFLATVASNPQMSVGVDDGTDKGCLYDQNQVSAGTWNNTTSSSLYLTEGGTTTYAGVISALGADGFTVTWTKGAGAKTGTATIVYLAIG